MQTEEEDIRTIKRWFSIGDFLTIVAMLVALAASYGSLSTRLDRLVEDMKELQARDITPGAATQIAAMQEKDLAQDTAIQELRLEPREQRQEILSSLQRVEQRLEAHDQKR